MSFFVPTMESLPEEMIEHMSKYLLAYDLASCCAVSSSWREVFGGDRLWRVHCDETLPQYLDESSCMVEPHFSSLEPEDTTLSAIGEWRLNFMKETRLKNNWRSGKFRIEQSQSRINDRQFIQNIFFQDSYVLVFRKRELEVWDVNKTPTFKSSFSFNANYDEFKFHDFQVSWVQGGDKFVAITGLIVRVYSLHIDKNKLELLHVFRMEMSEKCYESTEEDVRRLLTEQHNVYVKCSLVGSVLVGIPENLSSNKIYIWNVETGQKLKEEDFPFGGHLRVWGIYPIPACEQTKDIVLEVEELVDGNYIVHWYVYSLSKLMCLPFHHEQTLLENVYPYHSIIFDKYVAVSVNGTLSVYNYLTNDKIYTTPCDGLTLLPFRNFIVFNHCNKLHLVDPVNESRKEPCVIPVSYGTPVEAVGTLGIVVQRPGYSSSDVISFIYTSININDTQVPVCNVYTSTLPRSSWVICPSGTKLVLLDFDITSKPTVVHFW